MRHHVAHATRGRLRVRYPVSWLRRRRSTVEARLRELTGVRAVLSSTVTGSIIIDYDPFALAEQRLIAELGELSDRLDRGPSRARRPSPPSSAVTGPGAPLLRLIGSGTVLATAWLPVPGAVLAGLVVASDLPARWRAGSALQQRRVDGDVLEASALALLLARGNFVASALLTGLRSLGDLIVAKSVVTTRRSLYRLVAEPGKTVASVERGRRRPVRVEDLTRGDVITISGVTRTRSATRSRTGSSTPSSVRTRARRSRRSARCRRAWCSWPSTPSRPRAST